MTPAQPAPDEQSRGAAESVDSGDLPIPSGQSREGFLHAAFWSFLSGGGRQALKVGVTFVLAALLGPEAYGLAAMALVFVLFIEMLQRQGMGAALVQRKHLTRNHLDTAFWMLLAISVVLIGASVAASGWWASVNRVPALQAVIIGLTPMIPLQALSIVQDALLRRDMAFKDLAKRELTAVAAGGLVGVTAAVAGWGVWALVAQHVTIAAVGVVVLWTVNDWRPGFNFSWAAAKELWTFSLGLLLSSMGSFVNSHADTLLVGLFFGPTVVGIYRLGLRLVETLVTALSQPVQAIGLPELAPHQDAPRELRNRVDRLTRLAAVATLPALGILAGSAPPLVELLGGDWTSATAVTQVLCIVGVVRAWVVVDGALLVAVGRPFVQAAIAWLAGLFSAAAFIAAGVLLQGLPTADQALGIAVARASVWGVGIVVMHLWIVHVYAGQAIRESLTPMVWPGVAGLAATIAGVTVGMATGTTPALVRLAATGTAATVVAGTIIWLTVPEAVATVRGLLSRRRTQRSGASGDSSVPASTGH